MEKAKKKNSGQYSTLVRVPQDARVKLRKLSDITGLKMYRLLNAAVDMLYEAELRKLEKTKKNN